MEDSLRVDWILSSVNSEDSSIMTIELRAVEEIDKDFLFSIYASTRADEMDLVDWSDEQKDAFLHMQFDAQSKFYIENYPGAEFQVITFKDQPIGRLYIHRRKDEIRIMDIALLPEYRNLGIGSALLQDILKQGENLSLPVTIHVEHFNPALRLYKRMGFRQNEDNGVYLLMEWSSENKEQSNHD